MRRLKYSITGLLLCCAALRAASPEESATRPAAETARDFYNHCAYSQSLKILLAAPSKGAEELHLMGQDYFMMGDYKKSTDALEKAAALNGTSSQLYMWLGRAYGRRAETASPFTASGYASKARKAFEKSVELDLHNRGAVGDLLDYYLGAPGFLGGGLNKAEDLARKVEAFDQPEGHYLLALVEEKRKHYDAAEQHLREALELAPKQMDRVLVLARYLAKRGRTEEIDTLFARAAQMEPQDPRVMYYRAETYVESWRNLEEARRLLERYIALPLTPDDPPRESAQALLNKIRP
jgi:cytochrome c-type biogenesis protein CcmH/NrfG